MRSVFLVDGKVVGVAAVMDGMQAIVAGPAGSMAITVADQTAFEVGWACTVAADGTASFSPPPAPPVAPARADDQSSSAGNTKPTDAGTK